MPSAVQNRNDRPRFAVTDGDAQGMSARAAALASFRNDGPFATAPDPAMLICGGRVLATNAAAAEIARDAVAMADLVPIAETVVKTGDPVRRAVSAALGNDRRVIEFDIMRWGDDVALAIGRDATVAAGIRETLEMSRERYRALLAIAVDCIWETGPEGALELLAPNDLFGHKAASLIGAPLSDLVACKAPGFREGGSVRDWAPAYLKSGDGQLILGQVVSEPTEDGGVRGCFRRS